MSEHPVNGWFISTRDLIGGFALIATIVGGILVFFLAREAASATNTEIARENTKRIDRLEDTITGPGGLNEKYTDIQAKLTLIANLLEGKREKK